MESDQNIIKRFAVRAIISNKTGEVLLVKRPSGSFEGRKWCLVGGKLEDGEKPIDATKREVGEEIGITDFEPTSFFGIIDNKQMHNNVLWSTHYFLGKYDQEPFEINQTEVSEVGFFSEENLDEINIAFDHRKILKKYFEDDRVNNDVSDSN